MDLKHRLAFISESKVKTEKARIVLLIFLLYEDFCLFVS
jgi:hypothetical protein